MSERKKIWSNILLFALPLLLGLVGLFIANGNERFRYHFPKYNCSGHSGWIYDRLNLIDRKVDIAFLGTSRTMDAINDHVLEQRIKDSGVDMNVLNMGYCRFGRNMHHLLAKRMLERWDLKHVILEINLKENWDGHEDFAYLASNEELFQPVMIFNDNYIEDIYKASKARFDDVRSQLFRVDMLPPVHDDWLFGHFTDTTHVASEVLDRLAEEGKHIQKTEGFSRWFRYQYSFRYIDKTIKMLEEKGCQVHFLYLPQYGLSRVPEEYDFFKKRGTVLIPPDSIYNNKYYWKDGSHMNEYGATAMSQWLKHELVAIIQPPH
ncbi:MAG: hypothetical protein R2800_07425 [Flavipsychrobacter sp.]